MYPQSYLNGKSQKIHRPFKPPRLINQSSPSKETLTASPGSPSPPVTVTPNERVATTPISRKRTRTPTRSSPQVTATTNLIPTTPKSDALSYTVLFRKQTNKKNKTWDGDGELLYTPKSNHLILKDLSSNTLSQSRHSKVKIMESGVIFKMGNYEVELQDDGNNIVIDPENKAPGISTPIKKTLVDGDNDFSMDITENEISFPSIAKIKRYRPIITPNTLNSTTTTNSISVNTIKHLINPRHDPKKPGAIVMPKPPKEMVSKDKYIVDVVVDPLISKHLRPHQKEGVIFLYECIMGFKSYPGNGALLADSMGLGKTLQTIALIWTLLKQNPIVDASDYTTSSNIITNPVIKKAMIVCPVSLITNWKREIQKWLGNDRIGIFIVNSKSNLNDFIKGRVYQIVIIGYEKLRLIQDSIREVKIDLIVCDEGHILKNINNKISKAIISLNCNKRIILSGTPIQNDLVEFYSMINFLNPQIFNNNNDNDSNSSNSLSKFKKRFIDPIMKGRQPYANKNDIKKMQLLSNELKSITNPFILRRDSSILNNYLPLKTETILFIKPTPKQLKLYKLLLNSEMIKSCQQPLRSIGILKKITNSPALARNQLQSLIGSSSSSKDKFNSSNLLSDIEIPSNLLSTNHSGKTITLLSLLTEIYNKTDEKVVIISQHTSTLDLLESLLKHSSLPLVRLDGSTPQSKRSELVSLFNNSTQYCIFAFLLTTRAGGVGLNLIGGSRLILFDTDWNPAIDTQAMARIYRDGQKKNVVIYRFIGCGGIEERIWWRGCDKGSLVDMFEDDPSDKENEKNLKTKSSNNSGSNGKSSSSTFTQSELKDLFSYHDGKCLTYDLIREQKEVKKKEKEIFPAISEIENDKEMESRSNSPDDIVETLGGFQSATLIAEHGIPTPSRGNSSLSGLLDFDCYDPEELLKSDINKLNDTVLENALRNMQKEKREMISFVFTKTNKKEEIKLNSIEEVEEDVDIINIDDDEDGNEKEGKVSNPGGSLEKAIEWLDKELENDK